MVRSRVSTAILTAGSLLLLSAPVAAEQAPMVNAFANAPGWVTVEWNHLPNDADAYLVQRAEPAQTWGPFQKAKDHYTDMNLQPSTLYKYNVCAVYGDELECSDWVEVTTQPPEQPRAPHPKPPPTVKKHEAYDEPSRIRIWWEKTGSYDRVIVRWRHKNWAGARQEDIDTSAREGTYDLHTPDPGTYVVLLKGCTLNFVDASNCGEWSAPFEFDTGSFGVARVECIPGRLKSGSPVFAPNGRAEYHFDNPPPGYTTVAAPCSGTDRGAYSVVGLYRVHGVWNPKAPPGAWDKSDANTTESFAVNLFPAFSPERAPRRPDVWDPTVTINFLTRARCDRDPWLHANAVCRRTGDNVPQDIRQKWPTLLTEPFPHTRKSIPAAERGPLLARYNQVSGQLVGTARPANDPSVLAAAPPRSAQTIQGQASPKVSTAATATAQETRTRSTGQSAQPQRSTIDSSAEVVPNPKPLSPSTTTLVKPRETVLHAPATQTTRAADVSRGATPLQQSPLSKELAAEAEGKELVELLCRGGDMFNFHGMTVDPAAARLAARDQPASKRVMMAFQLPKKDAQGRYPSAGEDGRNLGNSQCAFVDREFGLGNPPGVVYDEQPSAADASIERRLSDPAQYWTFTVFNTNYGHFRAVRHGPWTPPGKENVGTVKQPLVGGKVLDRGAQEANALLRLRLNGAEICSASLLRNEWVVTAAHCIDNDLPGGGWANFPASAVTLLATWKNGDQTRNAIAVHSFRPLDVAIIQVDRPFSRNGSTWGFRQRVWSDGSYRNLAQYNLQIFGRGINRFASGSTMSSSDGQYRYGLAKIRKIDNDLYWYPDEVKAAVAGGDSGGPSFTTEAVSSGLTGVHSYCKMKCVDGQMCGDWPGPPGSAPPGYRSWAWAEATTMCADAPIEPAWDRIYQIMEASVPPEAEPMRVSNMPYGAVRYTRPTMTAENGRTHWVDGCREWAMNCGQPAANTFCRKQDDAKPDAMIYKVRNGAGVTAVITSGQVCNGPGCGGFDEIVCASRATYELARTEPRPHVPDKHLKPQTTLTSTVAGDPIAGSVKTGPGTAVLAAAQPATIRHTRPQISVPGQGSVPLDVCRAWATDCGQPAADAYCREVNAERPRASAFAVTNDIGRTAIISSRQICADAGCDGFAYITCATSQ